MSFHDLKPDRVRPVRVLVGGWWRDGELEAYREDCDGTWRGWVRWSDGAGTSRVGWFGKAALREAQANPATAQ